MKYLILNFLLIACTHNGQNPPTSEFKHTQLSESDVQQCKQYEREILLAAFDKDKTSFVKDEVQARYYLQNFDVKKGLSIEKSSMISSIISNCSEERVIKFNQIHKSMNKCTLMFSELGYFQSLASALKLYRWPIDLNLEGKKVALDYVKFYSTGDFPLLNRLVALSVLDELSINKIVNEKLHDEIKQTMLDAKNYVESLQGKLNKDPTLSCESIAIIQDELSYSKKLSSKMQAFLRQI